jgi:hypothetical protein
MRRRTADFLIDWLFGIFEKEMKIKERIQNDKFGKVYSGIYRNV